MKSKRESYKATKGKRNEFRKREMKKNESTRKIEISGDKERQVKW